VWLWLVDDYTERGKGKGILFFRFKRRLSVCPFATFMRVIPLLKSVLLVLRPGDSDWHFLC